MKLILENWKEHPKEENEKNSEPPKVTCRCLCLDCIFNKNKYCIAEEIDLDFAETKEGKTICECKTYTVKENEINS